jgi:MoxR-like ATPase
LLTVVERTRTHEDVVIGVSPRGSQALLRAVQVHAVLRGRDYVTPDDVKALAKPVLAHRLVLSSALRYAGQDSAKQLIDSILREVPVPTEEKLAGK